MPRILVVEDNADVAFGLRTNLEVDGHDVTVCDDGLRAIELAREWPADLVLLDLSLPEPGLDGLQVLRAMRKQGIRTPVIVVTARAEESDKLLGFRMGADDYVAKPFSILELLARIEALLRRSGVLTTGSHPVPVQPATRDAHEGEVVRFGEVEVRVASRLVRVREREVPLAPKEFDLLMALVRRNGAVADRLDLLREVWGYASEVTSRTVDTHIADLRRKLERDPAHPASILTVRKAGYRLAR